MHEIYNKDLIEVEACLRREPLRKCILGRIEVS
jgi:hypothetical protein